MPFRFRQFTVEDTGSPQRVGTDAMLLGAWSDPKDAARILDVGTGCGVLSLMLAQRCHAFIHAIDIDEKAVSEANQNFGQSPWSDRLGATCIPFQELTGELHTYDYIITNPPFFSNSLASPSLRKNLARHDNHLSAEVLASHAALHLSAKGTLGLILPVNRATEYCKILGRLGMFCFRSLTVHNKPGAPPRRILMEFSSQPNTVEIDKQLIIRHQDGNFSTEYLELTHDYHNF